MAVGFAHCSELILPPSVARLGLDVLRDAVVLRALRRIPALAIGAGTEGCLARVMGVGPLADRSTGENARWAAVFGRWRVFAAGGSDGVRIAAFAPYDPRRRLRLPPMTTSDQSPASDGIHTAILRAAVAARLFDDEPSRVGRFIIERRLGAGGMGTVYLARDPQLLREVAIKLLHAREGDDTGYAERALREARSMAKLQHPNVVAVFEAGEHSGGVYIAMEYVRGSTLRGWLGARTRSIAEIVAAFAAAGRGLAAAHAAGLIHRDFKPDNVLVGEDGRVAVTDFGLARGEAVPVSAETRPATSGASDTPVSTEGLAGTPAYMAPECLRGGEASRESDQFSFCVSLYEALFGVRPYGSSLADISKVAAGAAIRLPARGPRLPRWLRGALLRGLRPQPQARWPNMAALVNELATAQSRRRRNFVIAAAIPVVALAIAMGRRDDVCRDLDAPIRAVWTPEAQSVIADRIEAAKLPYGRASWASASAEFERWVRRWDDTATSACRARVAEAESADVLDRKMACLDRGRRAASALIAAMSELAGPATERVAAAMTSLPAPEDCSNLAALARRVPLPVDAILRAPVEVAITEIAQARSAHALGDFDRARELAQRASENGREHAPTHADAQIAIGDAEIELGNTPAALAAFDAAIVAAERGGADDDTALAWVSLVDARVTADELDMAGAAVRMAEAKLDHAGDRGRTLARLLRLKAEIAVRLGKLEDATALVRESSEILQSLPTAMTGDLASARIAEGFVDYAAGRYEEALSRFRAAAEDHGEVFGAEHPRTLLARTNVANVLVQLQRLDEALVEHQEVLSLRRLVLGPDHPILSANLIGIAGIYYHRNSLPEAVTTQLEAIRLLERARGAEHDQTLGARENLVAMLVAADRSEAAIVEIDGLLATRMKSVGSEDPVLAFLYESRARAHEKEGRIELAVADVARAIALTQKGLAPDHASLVGMSTLAAGLALRRGMVVDAGRHIERALAIGEAAYGPDSPVIAPTLRVAADVAVAGADAAKAEQLRVRAAALVR